MGDMPEIVDSMPSSTRRSPYGPEPKYPWAEIFDGRVHLFTPDEVPGTFRNFSRQVRAAAARSDVTVRVMIRKGQGVYVQAEIETENP